MALTLGAPTLISGTARDAQANSFDTLINAGTTQSVRLKNGGGTVLVTWLLNATDAFTGPTGGNGQLTAAFQSSGSATASAGAADTAATYEILADSTVHWTGGVTGGDTITAGQTVNISSLVLTWPAS